MDIQFDKNRKRRGLYFTNQPQEIEYSMSSPEMEKMNEIQELKEKEGYFDHVWDSLIEKVGQTGVSSWQGNVLKYQEEKDAIASIEEYSDVCKQLAQHRLMMLQRTESGDTAGAKKELDAISGLLKRKTELDEYFKSDEGRSVKAIRDAFYLDPGELDKAAYIVSDLKNFITTEKPLTWTSPIECFFELLGGVFGTLGKFTEGVVNSFSRGQNNEFRASVLSQLSKDEAEKYYVANSDEFVPDYDLLNTYLQDRKKTIEDETQNSIDKINTWQYLYREGRIGGEHGLKIADPETIPESFRLQQNEGIGWDPDTYKFIIPELGSSISMFGNTAMQMTASALIKKMVTKLPKKAGWLLTVADVAQSLYFTRKSRIDETNSEATDAYTERVKDKIDWNNLETNRKNQIINNIDQQLDKIGIDTKLMDDDQKLSTAITFGLKTGDDEFDSSQKEARKGLMKLINANNALAYNDYLESLPFTYHGGAVLNRAQNLFARNTYRGLRKEAMPFIRQMELNTAEKATQELKRKALASMSEVDLLKIGRRLQLATAKDYLKTVFNPKTIGGIMLEEGLEEGVQHKLGEAYKRGEYDHIHGVEQPFSIPEVMFDLDMSANAVLDFFGINPNSPENASKQLRQSMIIGALDGVLFHGVMTQPSAITEAFVESRANAVAAKLAAKEYGKVDDEDHINIFLDSFSKIGVNPRTLHKSLSRLREYLPEKSDVDWTPTTDFLDRDIDLMYTTYNVWSGKEYKKFAKKLGYKLNSDEYRTLLTQTVESIFDLRHSLETMSEHNLTLTNKKRNIVDTVVNIIRNTIEDENFDWNTVTEELKKYRPLVQILPDILNKMNEPIELLQAISGEDKEAARKAVINYGLFRRLVDEYNLKHKTKFSYKRAYDKDVGKIRSRFLSEFKNKNKNQDLFTMEDVAVRMLHNIFEVYQDRLMTKLGSRLNNRSLVNKTLRKLTGLDIYTEGLDGIVKNITDRQNKNKKANSYLYGNLSLIRVIDHFLDDVNISQTLQSLDEDIFNTALTYGLFHTQKEIARAYNPILKLEDLNDTKNVIFGDGDVTSGFKEELARYNEELKKITELGGEQEASVQQVTGALNTDKGKLALVRDRVRLELKRKAVVHKMRIEEAPYNQALVDAAENGDTAAQERVLRERELMKQEVSGETQDGSDLQVGSEEKQEQNKDDIGQLNLEMLDEARDVINGKSKELIELENRLKEIIEKAKQRREKRKSEELQDGQRDGQQDELTEAADEDKDTEPAEVNRDTKNSTETKLSTEQDENQSEGHITSEEPVIEDPIAEEEVGEHLPEPSQVDENLDNEHLQAVVDAYNNEQDAQELAISADEQVDGQLELIDRAIEKANEKIDESIDQQLQEISDLIENLEAPELSIQEEIALLDYYGNDTERNLKILDRLNEKVKKEEDPTINEGRGVDIVADTAFYSPSAEDIIDLTVDGQNVVNQLPHKLKPGKELAKKLIQKDWLKNAKKYYIVTRDKDAGNDSSKFSVILIIDDGEYCYASALRRSGYYYEDYYSTNANRKNKKINLETKLMFKGLKEGTTWGAIHERENDIINQWFETYRINHPGTRMTITKYRESLTQELLELIEYSARKYYAKPKSKVLTRQLILDLIRKLEENRQRIIDAYLDKDSNGNYIFPDKLKIDEVRPKTTRLSNGKINSKKQHGWPVFRKIVNGTVHEVLQLFNLKKLTLALGLGVRGSDPFAIRGMSSSSNLSVGSTDTDIFDGIGLSGKIYMIVESPNGSKVPVMLSEQKLNELTDSKGNTRYINSTNHAQLTIDPITREIDLSNSKPSVAEVLLYLICGQQIGTENYGISKKDLTFLKQLFINEGENTILNNIELSNIYNILGLKQLHFDGKTLNVGMLSNGRILLKKFSIRDLFTNTEQAVQNRQLIVDHIAQNLHFNTDEAVMTSLFSDTLIRSLVDYMDAHEVDHVDLFDCPQMRFKRSDLVHEENGRTVNNNMTAAAWMIANDKIMTDVGEDPLVDPFIYAFGVEDQNGPKQQVERVANKTEVSEGVHVVNEEQPVSSMTERFKNMKNKFKMFLMKSQLFEGEDRTKHLLSMRGALEHVIIDMSTVNLDAIKTKEQYLLAIKDKLSSKEFKEFLKKNHGIDNVEITEGSTVMNLDNCNVGGAFNSKKAAGRYIPEVVIKKNGDSYEANIRIVDGTNVNMPHAIKKGVTGVFSRTKGRGKLDVKLAKKWLNEMLGIRPEQVVITDAIMRSCDGKEVFALTNIASDMLNNPFTYIMLNSEYGDGLQYHEAWHYVNLLMHNRQTRMKIYENYAKTHKISSNIQIKEIEEMMAEDFRRYMLLKTATGLSGVIRRFFDNIKTFIKSIGKNKPAYRSVYHAISTGKYSHGMLDKQSVEEFKKRYEQGIPASFNASGVSEKIINQLNEQGLVDYHVFYDTILAINEHMMNMLDIRTEAALKNLTKKGVLEKSVKDAIDSLIELNGDNEFNQNILEIFKNNDELLVYMTGQYLSKYGVRMRTHKKRSGQDNALDKEDNPDNIWDIQDIEISRKDNAAAMTKLFFSRIPKFVSVGIDENGNAIFSRKVGNYGVAENYTETETWANVLDNLYKCDSFAERDENGEYKSSSLMGNVERLSKSNVFFKSLLERLQSIQELIIEGEIIPGNVQLLNQIYATINSSKVLVIQHRVQDLKRSDAITVDDYVNMAEEGQQALHNTHIRQTLDPKKKFDTMADNTVRAMAHTPRIWSQNVVALGMLDSSGRISDEFVKHAELRLTNIRKQLQSIREGWSDAEKKQVVSAIKQNLIDLYNYLGIDVDGDVLDLYLSMQDNVQNSVQMSVLDEIKALLSVLIKATKGHLGNLENIISTLKLTRDKNKKDPSTIGTLFFLGTSKTRSVNQLYNNYVEGKNGKLTQMQLLAKAHSQIHPSSSEFTVQNPEGKQLYPVGQNNMITDKVRWLDSDILMVSDMLSSPYCAHSVILQDAYTNLSRGGDGIFEIFYNAGLGDKDQQRGADYMGLTPIEDYILKIDFTQKGYFVSPTMADKKTWYCFKLKNRGYIDSNGNKYTGAIEDFMVAGYTSENLKQAFSDLYDTLLKAITTISLAYLNTFTPEQQSKVTLNDIMQHFKTLGEATMATELLNKLFSDKNISILNALISLTKNADTYKELFYRLSGVDSASYQYSVKMAKKYASKDTNYKRFSDSTLNVFAKYFLDEIDTVIKYYSKENIKYLISHPNARIDNYDGKVKNGKLLFGGNGGKFRYFLDISNHLGIQGANLNQVLQALYNLQQKIEDGTLKDPNATEESSVKFIPSTILNNLVKNNEERDGYELIRWFLDGLRKQHFRNESVLASSDLYNQINKMLIKLVEKELKTLTGSTIRSKDLHMINVYNGFIKNRAIPEALWKSKIDALKAKEEYSGQSNNWYEHNAIYMTIANHVANNILSVIEFEKIFAGDPAYYSWKPGKKTVNGKSVKSEKEVTLKFKLEGQDIEFTTKVDNMVDRSSDKIKRLGSLLSPGEEIKTDYTENELEALGHILGCKTYTNVNLQDLHATTLFEESVRRKFKILILYDYLANNKVDKFEQRVGKNKKAKWLLLDSMYSEENGENIYNELFSMLDKETQENLTTQLNESIDAFVDDNINVADALVMIRPEMYRKIRIGLGQWSIEEDVNGYSDELAYKIMTMQSLSKKERDDLLRNILSEDELAEFNQKFKNNKNSAWLHNHKIAAIVSKFEMFPLKMSYFQNEYLSTDGRVVPMLNKMAIFPWFEHNATSTVGRELYKRMNLKGQELDMISFESAVKVGATQNKVGLQESDSSIDELLTTISDLLNMDSDVHINYETGLTEGVISEQKDRLPVRILQVNCIRMQLNTLAHHQNERNLGTLMFKLAFSNIVDDILYGSDTDSRPSRNGRRLKNDIMSFIDELTTRGYNDFVEQFYTTNGDTKVINDKAVRSWVKQVIVNNNMGSYAKEVIDRGGCAACLPSRRLFENSASAKVNSHVVAIETQGGTAVQLSMFGFFGEKLGNDAVSVWNEDMYATYSNGEELKWDSNNGSMQVLLSIKFFKNVVPKKYQGSYAEMRQWLIDNGVIGSRAKPFALGYRIPTQGMSSIFVMQVADVLPAESGDLVVVPREFTAQTGSDFDVDKLFIASLLYNRGEETSELYSLDFEKLSKMSEKERDLYLANSEEVPVQAILNALLMSYMDVVGDKHNFLLARGSIDTTTNIIKKQILPILQKKEDKYSDSFDELTPSFQSFRKQEFAAGKTGIGAFALNVTNMALTQYSGLTMDIPFADEFGLKPLYSTHGKDGILISNWLSAMVNAMVDVAKDPYIFDINVVSETYNMSNFLIRTGNGGATFTFLAQPAIKEFISMISSSKGVYGKYLETSSEDVRKRTILKQLLIKYLNEANALLQQCLNSGLKVDKNIQDLLTYWNMALSKGGAKLAKEPSNKLHDIFDMNLASKVIDTYGSPEQHNLTDRLEAAITLVLALSTYNKLSKYADAMSQLVLASRIDTEKFGNTIVEQQLFKNTLNLLMYSNLAGVSWTSKYLNPIENKWKTGTPEHKACVLYNAQRPLINYFYRTFLMHKLNSAMELTRGVNQHQLISATDAFRKLFEGYLGNVAGYEEYDIAILENGVPVVKSRNHYRTFSNKMKPDTAKAVAQAIETIMLFKILMSGGQEWLSRQKDYSEENATGPIDFTCGGDITAVISKMKELTIGDNTIVDRLTKLKVLIEQAARKDDPTIEDYALIDGLVDSNGNIVNDLLKYLVGIKATKQIPIDHIQLSTNSINTSIQQKDILRSSFGQLLQHGNIEVRKLARDLAFYAYYSQYNQNTIHSFFDLIPVDFAGQYMYTISNAIKHHSNIYDALVPGSKSPEGFDYQLRTTGGVIDQFTDVICRNFYKDNDVVPVCNTSANTSVESENAYFPVYTTYSSSAGLNSEGEVVLKDREYGGIFTTKNSEPYIKIVKGGKTFLYKKVAVITRTNNYKTKSGKVGQKLLPDLNLYARVPLAGIKTNGVNMYEFYADLENISIYSFDNESAVTNKMRPENAMLFVVSEAEKLIMKSQKKGSDDIGLDIEFTLISPIPEIYNQLNEDIFFESKKLKKENRKNVGDFGSSESGNVHFKAFSKQQLVYESIVGKKQKSDVIIGINSTEQGLHSITTEDIKNGTVVEKMRQKLINDGVFESDVVIEEARKSQDIQGGVTKDPAGVIVSIFGEFTDVVDTKEAQNLADSLIKQLVTGGLDMRYIRFEGGSLTSKALARAIDKYSDIITQTSVPLNPYLANVFFNTSKMSEDEINSFIFDISDQQQYESEEDVVNGEFEEYIENRTNIKQAVIEAYNVLRERARLQKEAEEKAQQSAEELFDQISEPTGSFADLMNGIMGSISTEENPMESESNENSKEHENC